MTLAALLKAPSLTWEQRAHVARALAAPSCWPHDPALAAAALAHGFSPPPPPAVGVGTLVAVAPLHRRATLFALRRTPDPHPLALPQGPVMRDALRRAEALAPATLPVVVPGAGLGTDATWEVLRVFAAGGGESLAVEGASFGLAMLLTVASVHLDEAVPADVLALATLDSAGRAGLVQHLDEKLALVRGAALGVRRVLVAAAQRDEALRHAGPLEVVAVDDAVEALAVTFAGVTERLQGRWRSPDEAREAAEWMLKLALVPPRDRTVRWRAVADAARTLADALRQDPDAQERATFAHTIAARHAGDTGPLPWPSARLLAGLSPSRRYRAMAQGVQAAADAGHPEARARIAEAERLLADDETPGRDTLEVRGAIGRALATLRAYEAARDTLARAVEGWWQLDDEAQASFALSELLRVCGVLGDTAGLARARRRLGDFARAHPHETLALTYLRLAEGRALVLAGQPAEALAVFVHLEGRVLHPHVRASWLRGKANAHAALGHAVEARALREASAAVEEVPGAAALVALDAALDDPSPDDAALVRCIDTLVQIGPQGIHGLLGPGTPAERATRIAREYPY